MKLSSRGGGGKERRGVGRGREHVCNEFSIDPAILLTGVLDNVPYSQCVMLAMCHIGATIFEVLAVARTII